MLWKSVTRIHFRANTFDLLSCGRNCPETADPVLVKKQKSKSKLRKARVKNTHFSRCIKNTDLLIVLRTDGY